MTWWDWLVITVYALIFAGIWYIIWKLGKERGDE